MQEDGAARPVGVARGIHRRTIVQGAAWSAPIIAVAKGLPASASSPSECEATVENRIEIAPASSSNLTSGFEAQTGQFIVPDGVTQLTYEIAGGGGGVNTNWTTTSVSKPGGDGDLIVGTLQVVPGMVLDLVVGNGGIGVPSTSGTPANTTIKGGGGYGSGGDMLTGSGNYRYAAGTGGGGSAILVGGLPLVVAGGGGGAGGGSPLGAWTWNLDAGGGNGGLEAGAGTKASGYWTARPGTVYSTNGGAGASGAEPGIRENSGKATWSGDGGNGSGRANGNSGSAHVPGTGGNGGAGRRGYAVTLNGYTAVYTSGSGGGGYAGGASGDSYSVIFSEFGATIGGGGGGGSSYIAPGSVGGALVTSHTHSPAGNGSQPALTRNPGWIKLTYFTC